jgi:hypothetical protein
LGIRPWPLAQPDVLWVSGVPPDPQSLKMEALRHPFASYCLCQVFGLTQADFTYIKDVLEADQQHSDAEGARWHLVFDIRVSGFGKILVLAHELVA